MYSFSLALKLKAIASFPIRYPSERKYPVKRQKLFRHTAEISKVYLEIRNVKTLTDLVNWVEKLKDTIELSADLI